MNDVKNTILNKIKAGEVAMKPRWHFVLQAVLYGVGAVMVLLAATYLVSFIGFVLQASGMLYVPAFGLAGVSPFLMNAPWLLIGFALVFMIVLQMLVHHFAFAYQKPLVYSVVGMLLFVSFGTVFIMQTTVHERLYERVQKAERVPFIGGAYRQYAAEPKNITVGTVTGVRDWMLEIKDTDGLTWVVTISSTTKQPRNVVYEIGDAVLVLGEKESNRISADGIRGAENIRALHGRLKDKRPLPSQTIERIRR